MRLEEKLSNSVKENRRSSVLWSQWCFDREMLSKSLNVVSALFPHYSLHDSSHSQSIIQEIEKILGSNIERLSYIDVWLILEAAYWHDIGMIVTYQEKKEILDSMGFNDFLVEKSNCSTDLAQFAKEIILYQQNQSKLKFVDLERAFTFVLAEFIRERHCSRSKDFLKKPEQVGIYTPKSSLINSRLFTILGDIIESHGKPFDFVLEIPKENDGLENDDFAHPRFVSCLLRLGDLLDLDDGRHCPTQLSLAGQLPEVSFAHLNKHRSIVSKMVNEYSIEIRSICRDFDAFEVQNDWFAYIESEIENQDKYWGEIAPKHYLNKPPNIKMLSCELEGSIAIGKKASRMALDTNRAYGFLSGKLVYEEPLACISELLQNSVDAILDRIWLENNKEPISRVEFHKFSNDKRIDLNITQKQNKEGKIEYQISIIDSGKGMSLEEIKSILTVASQHNQAYKDKMRNGMPNWMKPSGFFGIGLQSVFSVSDKIEIITQSFGDSTYKITLRASKGKRPSFVVTKETNNLWKIGTKVNISILDEAIPSTISGKRSIEALASFDPLIDQVFNAKEAQIEELATEFAQFSEFPIYLNGIKLRNEKDRLNIVDEDNGLEYMVMFHIGHGRSNIFFRGRPVKNQSFKFYHSLIANIISERADAFLPLSREQLHLEGEQLFNEKLSKSLLAKKDQILEVTDLKEFAHLFYFLVYGHENDAWKSIEVAGRKLSEFVEPGIKVKLAFNIFDDDGSLASSNIIHHDSETGLILDLWKRLKLGIVIHKVTALDIKSKIRYGNTVKVDVFEVEVAANKGLSRIEESVISHFSDKKLSKNYIRYFLPVGKGQFPELEIPFPEELVWVTPISPFSNLFETGIILRSTDRSLEEDMTTMVEAIKKRNGCFKEPIIENALRNFYGKFPFESYEIKRPPL